MMSQIKPKTLFCLVTLIAFAGMLSLFSVKYFLETEKTKAEILKNIERNKVETDKLYQSVLDRIELQVNRKNTYTPDNIHEIIVDHYGLLQINNFRYTGMDLFWLSNKPEPTIIRRMGIEHYAVNSEVFKQQEKTVEDAYTSPIISDQRYIICRKILSQNKVMGNICIIQNINDAMLQVTSKKLSHRFMIGVSFNLGQVKFSVTNITPISHYFYYLLNYIICFILVFIALGYAFVKYSKTVKSRDEQHKKALAAIQKKCCCSDYLVSEVIHNNRQQIEAFSCYKCRAVYDEDIEKIISYFTDVIEAKKVSINYTSCLSKNIASHKCNVLLLQRLLMSLLTESLFTIPNLGIINITLSFKNDTKISLLYEDCNYMTNAETIFEKLKREPFFIHPKVFAQSVFDAGGKMKESYINNYDAKKIEIDLPLSSSNEHNKVVPINCEDQKDGFN